MPAFAESYACIVEVNAGIVDAFLDYCNLMRSDDGAFFSSRFLQICRSENPCFARSISEDNSTLLGGLDVRLVETPDAISDSNKTKLFFVEDIQVLG